MKKYLVIIISFVLLFNITGSNLKSVFAFGYNNVEISNNNYLLVDNSDDASYLYDYLNAWDDAANSCDQTDYPYQLKFVAKKNISKEYVNNFLSQFDTNYIFGFSLTHKFTIENLRFYFDNIGVEYNGKTWSFKKQYYRFNGRALDYVNLIKFVFNTSFIRTGLNGVEYDSNEFKVNTVAADFNYCNGESQYLVRFNNKDEFYNANEELEQNNNISIIYTYEPQINDMTDPIITTYEYNGLFEPTDEQIKKCRTSYPGDSFSNEKLYSDEDLRYMHTVNTLVIKSKEGIICGFGRNIEKDFSILLELFDKYKTSVIYALDNPSGKHIAFPELNQYLDEQFKNSINPPYEYLEEITQGTIIYRLYNIKTAEHFFTTKIRERDKLLKITVDQYSPFLGTTFKQNVWLHEGASCIINDEDKEDNGAVYRIYNPNAEGGDHHYTNSKKEAEKCVRQGWKWDNSGKPIFYTGGDIEIYRVYNKNDGRHHYTPNLGEKNKLVKSGWKDEGKGWNASEIR